MKMENRVALVTGAGSGIGKEIAMAFVREGAKVAVNDIDEAGIGGTLEEIGRLGGESFGVRADVASSREVKDMFARVVDRFGTLDILVNNAGIIKVIDKAKENIAKSLMLMAAGAPRDISLEVTKNLSDDDWQRMVDVHLYGTFYCTREALNIMEDKGYGKIVNIASICGMSGACAASPDYSAAKGGIIAFTRSVAREVIGRGVYVNAIAPGFIETPGLMEALSPEAVATVILRTPLGRMGTPADVAAVAVYLASEESNFMVGGVVSPNGAMVLHG